jgi:hypothetical protein
MVFVQANERRSVDDHPFYRLRNAESEFEDALATGLLF